MAAEIELDHSLAGLRAILGDHVCSEHPLARLIRSGTHVWFDARYAALTDASRFVAGAARLSVTKARLLAVESFREQDAELQLASTLLRCTSLRMEAPDEGVVTGQRQADYLLTAPRLIDVEVRTLNDPEEERREDAVADRVVRKLLPFVRASSYAAVFKVRDATPALCGAALDRQIVHAVRRAIQTPAGIKHITISSSGVVRDWNGTFSLADEIASVTLRPARGGTIMSASKLGPVWDDDRVRRALKKKSNRRQRSGDRPWVIALDASDTGLLDQDLLEDGAKEFLRESSSVSAVVLQRRTISIDDRLAFRSTIVLNPNARHSLTDSEAQLFFCEETFPGGRD